MKYLLENGLDVNKKNIFGSTLIEESMKKQIFNITKLLYLYNANIKKAVNMFHDVFFCENGNDIETTLYRLSIDAIMEFSKENKSENIYVFGFEYRYDFGSILISLNCEEDFEKTIKYYQKNYPDDYNEKETIEHLKFNTDDWKYHGYKSFIIISKENEEKYLKSLKNVLKKLNDEKRFDILKKSVNFIFDTYCYN